jgi:hypothetical protein
VPSYSPVFSQAFIEYTHDTPNAQFEVPEGFTAVIRQWSVSQEISDWLFQVFINNDADAPNLVIVNENQAGINTYLAGEGRWVVPGGGLINIFLSSVGEVPCCYVGGYLLRNTLT